MEEAVAKAPAAPAPAAAAPAAPASPAPVVEAPAPAPAAPVAEAPIPEAPAPEAPKAPRTRRKAIAGAASLSLSGIEREGDGPALSAAGQAAGAIPEDGDILACWPELAKQNASRPRLANALANAKLSIAPEADGKTLTFTVTNEAQKNWIASNLLHSLEGAFQKMVGSGKVRLQVEAAQFVTEEKIYLPSEQAKDLMSKNEEVKNLVVDLGLDV